MNVLDIFYEPMNIHHNKNIDELTPKRPTELPFQLLKEVGGGRAYPKRNDEGGKVYPTRPDPKERYIDEEGKRKRFGCF